MNAPHYKSVASFKDFSLYSFQPISCNANNLNENISKIHTFQMVKRILISFGNILTTILRRIWFINFLCKNDKNCVPEFYSHKKTYNSHMSHDQVIECKMIKYLLSMLKNHILTTQLAQFSCFFFSNWKLRSHFPQKNK